MKYQITIRVNTLTDEGEARIDDLLNSIDYDKFDLQFLSDDYGKVEEKSPDAND